MTMTMIIMMIIMMIVILISQQRIGICPEDLERGLLIIHLAFGLAIERIQS